MSWMDAEARFAEKFVGFEPRLPQRALALSIETAATEAHHLAAQAGCGVGKSFGGLIPMIDWAIANNRPVVVATATKVLQDQYAIKDLPALQRMYRPFRFAVIKGRSNYVCRAKLEELAPQDLRVDLGLLKEALAADGATGDVDRMDLQIDGFDRSKITTTSDECPGKKDCLFGSICFAELAKAEADQAHIVVTNHSMLATDSLMRGGVDGRWLLPNFGRLLVDEAHELEDYVTNALSNEITSAGLTRLSQDVAAFLENRSWSARAEGPIEALFHTLGDKIDPKERTTTLTPELVVEVADAILGMVTVLDSFETNLSAERIHGDDARSEKKKRLRKRVENAKSRLEGVIMADFGDLVRWIEKDDKRGVVLKYSPLSVGKFLHENIWKRVPSVLMSATLAVGTDFSYLSDRLGFPDGELDTFDVGTPFDFTVQARTFVPADAPDPKKNPGGWRAFITAATIELVRAADGRALLLFTSRVAMNDAYDIVAPTIEGLGHRVLRQGDAPTKVLADIFAADEHSVLFALKSFFTGMDIQGDSLRLVVIDKVPFPVPSDVIFKARAAQIDARNGGSQWGSRGSFKRLSIPMMVLTLLQGYGRLIRSMDDRGMVAILDPRLLTATYGKNVMAALPPAPVLKQLPEALNYLRSLEEVSV